MSIDSRTALERRTELQSNRVEQYARMAEIRDFEERVNALFAEGLIHGTTHLCMGQEALAVGLAAVLRPTDVVTATYRGHGVALALGMNPRSVLAEIMGKAEGCTGGLGGSMHLCDMSVGLLPTFAIIGGGIPVAAGAGLAFQNRGEDSVAVAVFGDGATNIGAFHEALNLAAVWKLPVVFVLDNNVYGEYSRINLTTPFEDLHVRAASYDMPGVSIDGMSIDAVVTSLQEAVDRARSGGGPTLIEAKTYRFAGHSRADTAPYRPEGELEYWQTRDPLLVSSAELVESGAASREQLDAATHEVTTGLAELVDLLLDAPSPVPADMFKNVYATVGDA